MSEKPQFTNVNEDFEGERNAEAALLGDFLLASCLIESRLSLLNNLLPRQIVVGNLQ